jgi:S1-C subfamily serine protease
LHVERKHHWSNRVADEERTAVERKRQPIGARVLIIDEDRLPRAGLKPGDLVTELGGTPVRNAADLRVRLALLRIGEVAEFVVSRPGGMLTVRAEMAERELTARSR